MQDARTALNRGGENRYDGERPTQPSNDGIGFQDVRQLLKRWHKASFDAGMDAIVKQRGGVGVDSGSEIGALSFT